MKRTLSAVVPAVLVLAFCGGVCAAPTGQDTPKDTLVKMVKAIDTNDKAAFTECIDASDTVKPLLELMCTLLNSTKKLRATCVGKWGVAEWPNIHEGMAQDVPDAAEMDKLVVNVQGDKATATLPGKPDASSLVRKDGVWKLVSPMEIPPKEDMELVTKLLKGFTNVFNQANKEAEKPGATVKSVHDYLAKNMVRVVEENAPEE